MEDERLQSHSRVALPTAVIMIILMFIFIFVATTTDANFDPPEAQFEIMQMMVPLVILVSQVA